MYFKIIRNKSGAKVSCLVNQPTKKNYIALFQERSCLMDISGPKHADYLANICESTYLRSEMSLRMMLITLELNTKLENTVKSPAIPETRNWNLGCVDHHVDSICTLNKKDNPTETLKKTKTRTRTDNLRNQSQWWQCAYY